MKKRIKTFTLITSLGLFPGLTLADIPLQQIFSTIENLSNGLMTRNVTNLEQACVAPLTYQPILRNGRPLLLKQLEFTFDESRGIYAPTVISDAEQVQSLFDLDEEKFVSAQKGKDFLDAKWKYFRSLNYSFKLKSYLHAQPRLSDWRALNHPPLRKLTHSFPFYSQAAAATSTKKSLRESAEFQEKIDLLSGARASNGNQVSFINDLEVTASRLRIATTAKKTLWGASLFMVCDTGTKPLVDLLAEKVKQGVDVRIMLDHFLQFMQKGNCTDELIKKGIKVSLVRGMLFNQSAFHMKMWVVDMSQAQVEGMNMIDAQTLSTGFNHLYRDSGLALEGPIVGDLHQKYIEIWNRYSTQKIPQSLALLSSSKRETKIDYSQPTCRLVTQDRKTMIDRLSPIYTAYLESAEEHIIASTVRRGFAEVEKSKKWNNLHLTLLKNKAIHDRVNVDLMVNSDLNVFAMYEVANSGLDEVSRKNLLTSIMRFQRNKSRDQSLKTGAIYFEEIAKQTEKFRAWSYMDFNHLKLTTIDQDTVISGSFNPFTTRSNRDAEMVVICTDRKLLQQVKKRLVLDLANSTPFPLQSQFREE